MKTERKVILVTGASSGMGYATATLLHRSGYHVYGTARRDNVPDPAFPVLTLDVTSDESAAACIAELVSREGRVDVVVNNAGFGICGAVEDTSPEEAQAQFDVNVYGVLRVCRAVLPHMRERGAGLIINISSLGGIMAAPFHGLYCASKFALEGMTEALRMEVKSFGVHVCMIEPGDIRTSFTANRLMTKESETNPAYTRACGLALDGMEKAEQSGPGPERIAKLVRRIIQTPSPRLRYLAAPGVQTLAPALKKILPQPLFEKIILSNYKL